MGVVVCVWLRCCVFDACCGLYVVCVGVVDCWCARVFCGCVYMLLLVSVSVRCLVFSSQWFVMSA